ncbi:MAG: methyltransferase domain-containing protein [Sphingomicrobium sp.]
MTELFDLALRIQRRDRAARLGAEPFLFERALSDILERLALIPRRFERALLIGCLGPVDALAAKVGSLEVYDPSALLAEAAGGSSINEEQPAFAAHACDLIVTIGTLDTINALQPVMRALAAALRPDGLLIGAMSGGDTLPELRAAMRAADAMTGGAQAHVHPRIEAAALAPLLGDAGLVRPVVDVDRVRVRYASFARLIADLRAMGATNILVQRPRRGLARRALIAASEFFTAAGDGQRTTETFEILHFAAWTPQCPPPAPSVKQLPA